MNTVDIEELVKQIVAKNGEHNSKEQVNIHESMTNDGIFQTVDEAVQAAKQAQKKLFDSSLERRQTIIRAIRENLAPYVTEMAERAVAETGMGNVPDKIQKNELALNNTPGVEDLVQSAKVITGDSGMTLYEYCPYGVVGAIAPSTNPTETLICNAIGMIAAGNAIYFSPHPGAKETSAWIIKKMNKIVKEASGIDNLIVSIETPSIAAAQEMMAHPEIALLVVTGGPGVVNQAMKSGKKVLGAGAGNPPTIVDDTANIEKAARDIVNGASFDNNVPCIAEKNIVAVESIADYLIFNLEQQGAFYIKEITEIKKLQELVVTEKDTPNKKFIGKSAKEILQAANIPFSGNPRLIIVESTIEKPLVVLEMLMPVVPIVRVPDFDCALSAALEIEQGLHHTATIHSQNVTRLNKAAREMQTSIFVKNGPSYEGIGFGGESPTTFTIATPTGEGTTTARHFARIRRCVLADAFSIK